MSGIVKPRAIFLGPRLSCEVRSQRRKHSLAQAGPVRLLISCTKWPTPPLPTFWPVWPSSCPNRKQEHLIIRGDATSCCCSQRLTTTGTSQESIHRAPSDHTSAVSYSTPAATRPPVPLSQASSRVNWLLQGLALCRFDVHSSTHTRPPGNSTWPDVPDLSPRAQITSKWMQHLLITSIRARAAERTAPRRTSTTSP